MIDIRNVQKTGNMHYVYLPTSWCKKYGINSDTKVSLTINTDGSISLYPEIKVVEKDAINITLPEATPDILIKLIMACYINPSKSFNIKLEKGTDISKIFDKRSSISALEFVELDGSSITHESSISVKDPFTLLKTMVKKIKNLVSVMIDNYDPELILKYEEEIDRSKLLITKSVIGSLVLNEPTKIKTVDLYYIARVSQYLEGMVDNLILVEKKEGLFLRKILKIVDEIKDILEKVDELSYTRVIQLEKIIVALKTPQIENLKTYGFRRIKRNLSNISEVFFDWAITVLIEEK
ncbi:MAG: hypothetical protein ABIC04_06720 [Nanoarchaeota archaeon]